MKRVVALLLVAVMIFGITGAVAGTWWTCPECGREDNDSQYCPDCGTKKPKEKKKKKKESQETDIQVGDYVYFGKYDQDGNSDNKERIRWLVLSVEDDMLFLLSDKGLAKHRFNDRSNGATWADSELREWLNSSFINSAFSSSEREAIQTTEVVDNKDHTKSSWNTKNRFAGTTTDKVFLLSYKEMDTLVTEKERLCEPTVSVRKTDVYTEKHDGHLCCWYWLRTCAFKNNAGVVDASGKYETCYIHHKYGVVRPALWVEASAVSQK